MANNQSVTRHLDAFTRGPYVRLFRGAMDLQFLFMDDNAPCHRTVAAEQLLESRRLAARTLPPVTIRELRLALQDEWAAMPQQLIDTLILSMGRRCETCLAVSSGSREALILTSFLSSHSFYVRRHTCFLTRFFKHIKHFSFTLLKWPQKPSNHNCELVTGFDKSRIRVLGALKTRCAEELIQVKSVVTRSHPIGMV
ncbi:hypothetical protein TNCV_587811 [Trichonephila clavipes]|nr:hypothetical protein TNCV_587811 [Trichonephila clavipes]